MESKSSISSGEVVLVNEKNQAELPPNIAIAVAGKEKRPLTEAQKENLKKLIERNKKLAAERKAERDLVPPKEPDVYKKKRPYKQDLERKIVSDRLSSLEELMKGLSSNFRMESSKTVSSGIPAPVPTEKKKKEAKPRKPKRPPTPTTTDCETEFTETDTDTEDDRTSKYIRKAQQKIETVRQIEQTLQRPNRYNNMSIF